jgi:molybdenum cofactor synthesis domain-containing protein
MPPHPADGSAADRIELAPAVRPPDASRQAAVAGLDVVAADWQDALPCALCGQASQDHTRVRLTVAGIELAQVALLDRFASGSAELEVTGLLALPRGGAPAASPRQRPDHVPGPGCPRSRPAEEYSDASGGRADSTAAQDRQTAPRRRRAGVCCRVVAAGYVCPGDAIVHLSQPLRIHIVTVSDRASCGVYEDRSGPAAEAAFLQHFLARPWHPVVTRAVVPDDVACIRDELGEARRRGVAVVVTSGGTGVGPRDVTPEAALPLVDKLIPGIMDYIRIEAARRNPNALLSRGIAGTMGQTLLYTLPGSPRAVCEYLESILPTLEHLLLMLRGVDAH